MFKKFLVTALALMTVVSAVSLSVSAENDGYTIKQYIYDYYNDTYNENVLSFTQISLTDTEQPNELWYLSNEFDKYELFENEISKVDTSFVVQTEKRYFITFESPNDNLLYLCITENGEMFFGRYADYNKPNYCEYIVKDIDNVINQLSEICEANKTTYTGVPSEKWDFADGDYTESLNGVSSNNGIGYSGKYFSAKANKKYTLTGSNLKTNIENGTITFTVKNKITQSTVNDENHLKMEYSFATDANGGFTAPMYFNANTDFYFEITTSNPNYTKYYGTYTISETDISAAHETTVNLNSGESSQLTAMPISEDFGYWKITVDNTTSNLISLRIYKETPASESIFYGTVNPQEQKYFCCEKNKPFENGNYYIMVNTDGSSRLGGTLSYTLSSYDEFNKTFNDTSGHWAESTINKWADKGIISGYPDGTFKPDSPVTRAELAKILTLVFDLQPSEFEYTEKDLSENDWYYNYLLCAGKYIPNYALPEINEKNQPYIDNRTVNAFLPEQNAMRMHVAESLVEIKREKEQSIVDVPEITVVKDELNKAFKDADYENLLANHGMIPENVRRMFEYTYLAKELNIMRGDTDGYFRPYDNVTRAELITMIDRMITKTDD